MNLINFPLVLKLFSLHCLVQEERNEVLEELEKRQTEKASIEAELEKFKECDPEVLEAVKKQMGQAKEAANRWTGQMEGRISVNNR